MFSQICAQSVVQNGEFCAKYEMSLLRRGTPHTRNKRTQQSPSRIWLFPFSLITTFSLSSLRCQQLQQAPPQQSLFSQHNHSSVSK